MIYELRTYTLQPGKQGEYLKLNAEVGRKIRGDKYGKFEGGWTTEFATLNQYVHLWIYPDMVAQENKILSAVTPFKPPTDSGNVYELRWYRAQVGRLGEWLNLAKGVLPSREKYSRNVCYWQTEAGQLNEAVHLWVYKDLNERAAARAKALGDLDWQSFLGKALPLLMSMQSTVLIPTTVSPMK